VSAPLGQAHRRTMVRQEQDDRSLLPCLLVPLRGHIPFGSTSARSRSRSGALTPHMPHPLLCHMPWAPMPRTLQRWLYQPRQQIRRQQGPWPWQVQCPQLAALPLICACQYPGVRLPLCLCRPSQLCWACGLICPTAQPTCGPVRCQCWCQRCRLCTPSLRRSHITIISPQLGNAASHVAVTTAGVIAAPHCCHHCGHQHQGPRSDGRNLRCITATCPRDLPARPTCATCPPKCLRKCLCSRNRAALSSQLASSKLHMYMALALSSGTRCKPRNLPTLPSSAAEISACQCYTCAAGHGDDVRSGLLGLEAHIPCILFSSSYYTSECNFVCMVSIYLFI